MLKTLATVAVVGTIAAVATLNNAPAGTFLKETVFSETEVAFHHFLAMHGKNYGGKSEYKTRLALFAKAYHQVMHHNMFKSAETGFTMGINEYSDNTDAEWNNMKGFKATENKGLAQNMSENLAAPASVDWRSKNAVNAVKNQGQCGSCWAFSTVCSVEGAYAIKHGVLKSFSESQLVDCSKLNHGCNGGSMDLAFFYIRFHELESEATYPYVAKGESCQFTKAKGEAKLTGHVDVKKQDPAALMAAVALGPVSIALEADQDVFHGYKSGIVKATAGCGTALDHGVAVVGYGSEGTTDYWLVRNSWGPTWGESGYIRLERTMGTNNAGVCGLQSQPTYPIIA
jgi:C1A family cysteine protease